MSTVVVFEAFGGPETLRVDDEHVGEPGPGQVRVANRVVGVNPADLKRLAGMMRGKVLVDLRNVYNPADAEKAGLAYFGIGRGVAGSEAPIEQKVA